MTALGLRSPDVVMRLSRMGAFFPTRLSFMRVLIRRLAAEDAKVTRPIWQMDPQGFGHAVYSVPLGGHIYSLIAFTAALRPEDRTDRVIAEAWDASFILFDGVPDQADIQRLQANAPKQEAGRFTETELVLSRANKSVRFFDHVVQRLAGGQQPDHDLLAATGYLMRTTAVYGNGKFGSADRSRISHRPGLSGPFQAELLTVWLIRGFSQDLANHVAQALNPDRFTALSATNRRNLGVGNATGLGMAPFLINHPTLLNNWMLARETALARVLALKDVTPKIKADLQALFRRARAHLEQWQVADAQQTARINQLRHEMTDLAAQVSDDWLNKPFPFKRLMALVADRSEECQELMVALVLEPNGATVDDLADQMASREATACRPAMTVRALIDLIDDTYGWAQRFDFDDKQASQVFWYTSAAKLEPRLGQRYEEPGADFEMPLDIARRVQALRRGLEAVAPSLSTARFLLDHPAHRYVIRRIQNSCAYPYSEIQDNLIDANIRPIDMLRCKLSFFGASKFDPKSDLWTRINMFQGAPLFDDLNTDNADDWWLPVLERSP